METYESRLNEPEIEEGYNTHRIVIEKLFELYATQPEESRNLFNDIAERITKFDNPKPPSITFNTTNHSYRVQVRQGKKKVSLFSSKDIEIVENKRNEWLRFNR